MAAVTVVGAPVPRPERPDKVTGLARYTADINLEGLLWGKILRSPYPHARIRRIDASRARQAPGNRAVITGQDIRRHVMAKFIRDMPVLCWEKASDRHNGARG